MGELEIEVKFGAMFLVFAYTKWQEIINSEENKIRHLDTLWIRSFGALNVNRKRAAATNQCGSK